MTATEMFEKANFIRWMGVRLHHLGEGRCESSLVVRDEFLQQHGYVHAGLITTLADHTAGGAGGSLLKPGEGVLTIEFKVNFLRPAQSKELFCVAETLKMGRSIAVVESAVYGDASKSKQSLLSKATVTLAVLQEKS